MFRYSVQWGIITWHWTDISCESTSCFTARTKFEIINMWSSDCLRPFSCSPSRSSTWTEHIKAFEEVSRKETHAALWGKLMHRELLLNTRVTSVPLHACICISSAPMWASGQLLSATLKWRRCCGILVLWRQQRWQKSRSGYVFLVSDYWPINWQSI